MTLREFESILKLAKIPVARYGIVTTEYPYIVWQELSTEYKWASGQTFRKDVLVEVVHFTKLPYDPSLHRLENALLKNKFVFRISHGFDPEDKIIINQFTLTVDDEVEVEQ